MKEISNDLLEGVNNTLMKFENNANICKKRRVIKMDHTVLG